MAPFVRGRRAGPERPPAALLLAVLLLGSATAACAGGSAGAGVGTPPASAPARSSAGPAFPMTVTDDDGVRVTIPAPPRRIITFAPSLTEVVFALGLGSRLVGVSGSYDDYPPAARAITHVGGAGQYGVDPNIEKVVSLHPDLFLAIEGGDAWKARLRALGIPVFTLDSTSLADTLHDIRTVGEVTGTLPAAVALTDRMQQQASAIEAKVATEPAVSCFFEVAYPPLYTVGPGSFVYGMLRDAGCDPVTAGATTAYPQWSVEALVKESPDVYVVGSAPGVTAAGVGRRPGFDALRAVADGRVVVVSSTLVTRQGPRVVQGLLLLAKALHPDLFP